MTEERNNPFQPRLGRIRSKGNSRRATTFLSRLKRTMSRAGGGGGQSNTYGATKRTRTYSRRVVVKARFVKMSASSRAALAKHVKYIGRDDPIRSDGKEHLFNSEIEISEPDRFLERASGDRHHFRFIVSPEDGTEIADMKPFVRDLVSVIERDLGSKLEWLGAIHRDTDHPHAHLVIRGRRDDGRDLVIPRKYISHTLRNRAEELMTLELGPQTQLEKDLKAARQLRAERVTSIDRALARMRADDGNISLSSSPPQYRRLNEARLRKLSELGLAEKLNGAAWRVTDGFETTLKELGERRDIVKQLNRAVRSRDGRSLQGSVPFLPSNEQGSITGAVLEIGVRGDMHDEPFIVVDGLDGRVALVPVKAGDELSDIKRGMIVSLSQSAGELKPSDKTVAAIAEVNEGKYSGPLHRIANPSASDEYIKAHIRRLEAMGRAGLVRRQMDGSWLLPGDYLSRVNDYQWRQFKTQGAEIRIEAWATLESQIDAVGLTWLDQLQLPDNNIRGFGEDVFKARQTRNEVLSARRMKTLSKGRLDPTSLERLRADGLEHIGNNHSARIGKRFEAPPVHGTVQGQYTGSIVRPEGRFAVIEREQSFSLIPWKRVLERFRGRVVTGAVRGRSVSWSIGRQRVGPL